MKSRGIVVTLMALPVCLGASAAIYFNADFASGKLPNNITVSDEDGLAYAEVYGVELPADGWMVSTVGSRGFAAVSPTRSLEGGVQKNSLRTVFFKVEEKGAVLRWAGKSILPDIAERYLVQVSEEGSESYKTVAEINGENYEWTFHTVSLDEFIGKNISVRFITDSGDGFMIAIDDIMAGVPEDLLLSAQNETPVYYAAVSDVTVRATVSNFGKDLDIASFVCKADGKTVGETPFGKTLSHGKSVYAEVTVPLERDVRMQYRMYAVDSEGKETALCSGDLFSSAYERTLLLDKGTGMWCNNCPKGIITANGMKRRFGDNLVIIETHAAPDRLQCEEYWPGLKFYAVPYMMLDRYRPSAGELDKNFDKEYWAPVKAEIVPVSCGISDDMATIGFKVRFADDTDNAADRYRIGYAVTRLSFPESVKKIFYQQNSVQSTKYDEYFFLPSNIPAELVDFHDVTVGGQFAFDGIENSLPASLAADAYSDATVEVYCPDQLEDIKRGRVVAYILDTENGRVLNCTTVSLDGNFVSGIENPDADSDASPSLGIQNTASGEFILALGPAETDFIFELRDMAGRLLFSDKGHASGSVEIHPEVNPGLAIATLRTSRGCVSAKIITK